jgi:RHS repeat-associated protein
VKTAVDGTEVERWDHYPYGETWVPGAPGDQHRYTGHLRDAESGNDYAGARYYSNIRGRWLSVDPERGDRDPQDLNRYAYVRNDPVNRLDPDGRQWVLVGCRPKVVVTAEATVGVVRNPAAEIICTLAWQSEPQRAVLDNREIGPRVGTFEPLDIARYLGCLNDAFGSASSHGGRNLPGLYSANLVLQVSEQTGVDAVLLAVTWAIESNWSLHPKNNGNRNGSVDIGPMQLNYQTWSGDAGKGYIVGNAFGTNLSKGQVFNGDPIANLVSAANILEELVELFGDKAAGYYRTGFGAWSRSEQGVAARRARQEKFQGMKAAYADFFDCIGGR